eukprot:TRINITY_DN47924_c0_g1_i1.p1 TRINITY_DN47924_c0_g1~~TRINITY_DN47924_c0_g1_i1.p1  ORF type:complete len:218 (+),score=14.86 TRINITY_DN47924_c0_g1_i1:73-654(+)
MEMPTAAMDAVQLFAVNLLFLFNLSHVLFSTLGGDVARSIHSNNMLAWCVANRVLFAVVNMCNAVETWLLYFWVFTSTAESFSKSEVLSHSMQICNLICGVVIFSLFTVAFFSIMNVASRSALYSGAMSETSVLTSTDRNEMEISSAMPLPSKEVSKIIEQFINIDNTHGWMQQQQLLVRHVTLCPGVPGHVS